jgi:hypothetical protein
VVDAVVPPVAWPAISAGDFVRQVKQLMDLFEQVAAAVRSAGRAMRRGVVACSWAG